MAQRSGRAEPQLVANDAKPASNRLSMTNSIANNHAAGLMAAKNAAW